MLCTGYSGSQVHAVTTQGRHLLLIRSTMHAPDQPILRSRWPHWFVDLAAPTAQSVSGTASLFMKFRELHPLHTSAAACPPTPALTE